VSSYYIKSPKWNGWKGRYEGLRKSDPLLLYLINARGSEEHTVNEIVSRQPGGIGINPAEGNSLYVERMEIDKGKIFIKSPQNIWVDFILPRINLLPVINRGRTYPVPTIHLGKPIDPTRIIEIAEAGVSFYKDLLDDVERSFVK
jgi:hypothetical protein